mmetsp:Transcript_109035/g.351941  ORF Transcript_109035/g.351941 Transcript_109035/m.351941 type:complete len:270 (-) Transcript_109035:528-1337(-)
MDLTEAASTSTSASEGHDGHELGTSEQVMQGSVVTSDRFAQLDAPARMNLVVGHGHVSLHHIRIARVLHEGIEAKEFHVPFPMQEVLTSDCQPHLVSQAHDELELLIGDHGACVPEEQLACLDGFCGHHLPLVAMLNHVDGAWQAVGVVDEAQVARLRHKLLQQSEVCMRHDLDLLVQSEVLETSHVSSALRAATKALLDLMSVTLVLESCVVDQDLLANVDVTHRDHVVAKVLRRIVTVNGQDVGLATVVHEAVEGVQLAQVRVHVLD